jgi:hypothetical protein
MFGNGLVRWMESDPDQNLDFIPIDYVSCQKLRFFNFFFVTKAQKTIKKFQGRP